MPNGGEHYETIGFCPHCRSSNIRRRRQLHRSMNWRCRSCNRVFQRPNLGQAVIHGSRSGFVFQMDVDRVDSQVARRYFRSNRRARRRRNRNFKRVLLVLFLLLCAALVVFLFLNPQAFGRIRQEVIGNTTDLRNPIGTPSISGTSGTASSESGSQSVTNIRAEEQPENSGFAHSGETDGSDASPAPSPTTAMASSTTVAPIGQEESGAPATPPTSSAPFSKTVQFFRTVTDATPTPLPPPEVRHLPEKELMLRLINEERDGAGLEPVEMGENLAAQLHAESSLANCTSSHWGSDGLKPYMRYSLAGGYQSNAENGHGSDIASPVGTATPRWVL